MPITNVNRALEGGGGRSNSQTFALLALVDAIKELTGVVREIRDRLPNSADQSDEG